MANHFLRSLKVGIRRRFRNGVRNGLAAVGGAWTLTELTTAALPDARNFLEAHGTSYLGLMAAVFVGTFIAFVLEPRHVAFRVPTTATTVTLKYGDLFAEQGDLLIGVNEFFDGELGPAVAQSSLHGQIITRNFGGSAAPFRAEVDPALAATGMPPTPTTRPVQPSAAYPMGTTAVISNGTHKIFLMAMATTDQGNFKASSDVPTLWKALKGGLEAVRIGGNGEPLAMPLFGNGQAGVNLIPNICYVCSRLPSLTLAETATASCPSK